MRTYEVSHVDRETYRADQPEDRCGESAGRNPFPLRLGSVRGISIEDRQRYQHDQQQQGPLHDEQQPLGRAAQPDESHNGWQEGDK
jgi:hypothetical protein